MQLTKIDYARATDLCKDYFADSIFTFCEREGDEFAIGDLLWSELSEVDFLLASKNDKPLGLAIYADPSPEAEGLGLNAVRFYAILVSRNIENQVEVFVRLLFQLTARLRQHHREYLAFDVSPNDDFTINMLESSEFKLIAPYILMTAQASTTDGQFVIDKANGFELIDGVDLEVPGGDPYLGNFLSELATHRFKSGVENGEAYAVKNAGAIQQGYFNITPNPYLNSLFGDKKYGHINYAYPYNITDLYKAAKQLSIYDEISIYAPITESSLIRNLENIGFRAVGAKLSFRLLLV